MVVHQQNQYEMADETLLTILENQEDSDYIAYYLQNMRNFFNLTKTQFSNLLNVNSRTYYNYEKGVSFPEDFQALRSTISRMLENKRNKLPLDTNLFSVDPSLLEQMIELHDKGRNTIQIGIELELDQEDVYKCLVDAGFTPTLYHYSI